MRGFIGSTFLLYMISCTAAASDAENSLWDFGLGVKATQSPFVGGDTSVSASVVRVTNKKFLTRGPVFPIYKRENHQYYLGANIGEWDTNRNDNAQLSGMKDLDLEINARAGVAWRSQKGVTDLEILKDVTAHKGIQARLRHTYAPETERAVWLPFAELQWMSADVTDYYTGVDAAEVALGRPAYETDSDYAIKAGIKVQHPLATKLTLVGTAELIHYGGKIADSPIIEKNNVWGGSLGVSYRWK
ncbi:MAG: Outer membrane scaffolding protein for murein synthesis, MipA/OmpV family [uncultured Thiotrichaceae bacterium]|uniref:Outer membrane scaffolding protein for murein synthesis, MipA/OmpV family n=1 Tax=uncultured Thiotrichaceae bacterium TaxID=298394 RepID=A0A6S6SW50_9GAMM|nr:MAG: Outer membrane scaffolding protein for murein synthesis, MipA/OmpV family [uncultured Thiotrichaceae bacterium]